jgi:hypothetical protein
MILTLATYKSCLPPNTITDATKFDAFETRALYKFFPKFLGDELVDQVADGSADEDFIAELAMPLANLTYLLSIPFFNLVLTNTGFGVVSNQNVAPASVERVKDLKEACLQAANDGMDKLLKYLEYNYAEQGLEGSGSNDIYSLWNQSSLNTGSLIETADSFSAAIGFRVPRHLFVDIKEHIYRNVSTALSSLFSAEFMTELPELTDTKVKPLITKALANLSWKDFNDAKPSLSSKESNPSSMFVKFHDFATKYANRALTLLIANLDEYPTFATYGYEAPYDNSDDNDAEGGFFIGGITA